MTPQDTIAAISTALGPGAISIVRLSGQKAFKIASALFCPDKGTFDTTESNFARFGRIIHPQSKKTIDEVVLIPYKGPHTYTGEDLVEINCHGGFLIPNAILSLCLEEGARLAHKGEFTERAFLAGRIDLTQAEAVLDLIQAKTGLQGQLAVSALSGSLGKTILELRQKLINLLAQITAGIDFPDEIGDTPKTEIEPIVTNALINLTNLYKTSLSGRFLREGLKVTIIGSPNVGKSSLLNQLLKFERAIVTDIPGTTRDSLEELLDLNGLPVILVDTAGIRKTQDQVEKIGIDRTLEAVNHSDLVLFMIDLNNRSNEAEEEIRKLLDSKPFITVGNKIDLCKEIKESSDAKLPAAVHISAKTGQGMESLSTAIQNFAFASSSPIKENYVSLNNRQSALCLKATQALKLVEVTLSSGLPQDCLATDLKTVVDALSEIAGESVSEEVIQNVFANFCVGK